MAPHPPGHPRRAIAPSRDRSAAFAGGGRREIVDEMIDGYVSWREACGMVAASYENWSCADRPDEMLAFTAYVAALDSEERAAATYQRAVALVARALAGRHGSSLEESSMDRLPGSAEVTGVRFAGEDRR